MVTKKVLFALLIFSFFIIRPAYGEYNNKNQAEWEIVNYDDNTIKETVNITGDVSFNVNEWDVSEKGGIMKLTRTVEDWQSYNKLTDKLPVRAEVKNFVLWRKTSLIVTAIQPNQSSLYSQVKEMQGINLNITVPAFITDASGEKVNEISASWNSEQMGNLREGQVILETITLEGFLIGLTGFLVGLIIIAVFFMRRLKKIEKIMEAEYSLENISLDNNPQEENNRDKEDNNWI